MNNHAIDDKNGTKEVLAKNSIAAAGDYLQQVCHGASKSAGWWIDKETGLDILEAAGRFSQYVVATKLCLIHSEISEAMEGSRKSLMDDKLPHRPMLEVELADAIIRAFDLAGRLDFDLGGAIAEKLSFNATRADHKMENRQASGGKAF